MALFFECMRSCTQNVLDTADIVRDRDFSPTEKRYYGIFNSTVVSTSTGSPLNRKGSYFHRLIASMAGATGASGPLTFSAAKTLPPLSTCIRSTSTPAICWMSGGYTGSTRCTRRDCIDSGTTRTVTGRDKQLGTPPCNACRIAGGSPFFSGNFTSTIISRGSGKLYTIRCLYFRAFAALMAGARRASGPLITFASRTAPVPLSFNDNKTVRFSNSRCSSVSVVAWLHCANAAWPRQARREIGRQTLL